jgi:hypothetical protein
VKKKSVQLVFLPIKLSFVFSAIASLKLLVADLALIMLGMNVLSLDLQVLANNRLLAHGARMLFRIVKDQTLAKARSTKRISLQIALVPFGGFFFF